MGDNSQYGEGKFILDHFAGRTGRFLDIGAFDGITFSNTRPLADLGWSGVCVEPSPPAFCHLMRNYEGNDKVELVNAAIVGGPPLGFGAREVHQPIVQEFFCNTADASSADMLSTLREDHRNKFQAYPFRKILIPGITWWDLFGAPCDRHFDFVNIDVEGINDQVFMAMPVGLSCEMICIELDPIESVMEALSDPTPARLWPNRKVIGGNILAWK